MNRPDPIHIVWVGLKPTYWTATRAEALLLADIYDGTAETVSWAELAERAHLDQHGTYDRILQRTSRQQGAA